MSHKIAFTGQLGSGKSSVARMIAESTGMSRVSAGPVFREAAKEKKQSMVEFQNSDYANSLEFNRKIDLSFEQLADSDESLILDGRLAWHNVPDSFKVCLLVHPDEAGKRVFEAKRDNEEYSSAEEATSKMKARYRAEKDRFSKLYNLDVSSFKNFDLIIDTTKGDITATAKLVCEMFDRHKRGKEIFKYWVSPENIFPTQLSRQTDREILEDYMDDYDQTEFFNIEDPIDIGLVGNFNFVVDGHHRGIAAAVTKKAFIPAVPYQYFDKYADTQNKISDFLPSEYSSAGVYDWEDCISAYRGDKYRLWTYPPYDTDAEKLDVNAISERSWLEIKI